MYCGNAEGTFIPPMVVYKAANVYKQWASNGVAGAFYAATESGWFDGKTFEKWFFEVIRILFIFLKPAVKSTKEPHLFIV